MTNSTVKKTKGPVRFEAIIPALIIGGLIYSYFALFFDSHLRHLIEFTGTHIYGAEVNIQDINTSFWRGSFELRGLQITDKEQPERNLVQINKIRFGLLWHALLRAKFVVN